MNWKFLLLCSLLLGGFTMSFAQTTDVSSPAANVTVTTDPPTSADVQAAQYVASKVALAKNRTVSTLDPSAIQNLPLGIVKVVGGQGFIIAIDSGQLTPKGATVSAFAMVGLPGAQDSLAFAGQNIPINPGGVGGGGAICRISLVSKQSIRISSELTMILSPKDPNYVEFDCNGFKDINLTGEFVFSRDLLLPDSTAGAGGNLQNVVATFTVSASDFSNMLFNVSVTPFRLPFLQDVGFTVKNAVADLSDLSNPSGVTFPTAYKTAYGGNLNLWHGIYIQQLTVRLPAYLKDNKGQPLTVSGTNLLIDDKGFTGSVGVKNLIDITSSGSDWPFSIDSLGVSFSMSHLVGGAMSGVIGVPFVSNDTLGYVATAQENNNVLNLSFLVKVDENKSYNMPFGGTLKLNKGSSLSFTSKGSKISGLANLSGSMFFNQPELKNKDTSGMKFTNLQLSTESPYLISGNFDANVNLSAADFPISIANVKLGVASGKVAIGFTVGLNLMNTEDKTPSITTSIKLAAKLDSTKVQTASGTITRTSWAFGSVQIDSIAIKNLQISAITLNGELNFYKDDPTYGNGFHGNINLAIQDILSKGVTANVYFGSKPTFRYWHVDVQVPTGIIPLFGPLYMDGIIGGASYRMSRKNPFTPNFDQLNKTAVSNTSQQISQAESGSSVAAVNAVEKQDQLTSNDVYLPDSTAGLSLMAGLTMVVAEEKLMNADAVLSVQFRAGGGLQKVEFQGGMYMLSDVGSRVRSVMSSASPPPGGVPVYAYLDMLYDADEKSFNAQLTTYVNAYGVIAGTGPSGKVGDIVLHFDPQDWYVWIGRPTAMLGITVANVATVAAYFQAGTKIDPFPPMPAEVQSIAGNINLNFMQAESQYASGNGIDFGAHLDVSVGVPGNNPDGSFKSGFPLPIFAYFKAGVGTDIMFQQYKDCYCKGSTSPIGIGGWYASGQAYAYLEGSVGVCWSHCRKRINFLSLAAAAVLQAKLPNPSWFRGLLAGRYSVLCGLIKGSFSFNFTIGDQCDIVGPGSEIGDIEVIADVAPQDGATAVSVFATPQVTFNMALNQSMQMVNDENQVCSYRVEADEIKIYNGATAIPANLTWNSDNTTAMLTTSELLPSQANLVFSVKLHWEKQTNGVWAPLKNTDGSIDTEVKQVKFTTDVAPGYIPDNNITYVYPVKQQYNFYPREYNKGYIKLGRGQAYLFHASDSGKANSFAVAFVAKDGSDSTLTTVSYDSTNQQVNFALPASMRNATIYNMSIYKFTAGSGGVDGNVQQQSTTTAQDADNSTTVMTKSLSGVQTRSGQSSLYTTVFRTSKYNSFTEKVNAFNGPADLFNIAVGNVYVLMKRNSTDETFDQFEIYGQNGVFQPMIQAEALNTASWLSSTINPTLYNEYASSGLRISWRDPNVLGVGPTKGMAVNNSIAPDQYYLSGDDIDNGFASSKPGLVYINYYLSYYVFQDYHELRDEVANQYLSTVSMPDGALKIFNWKGYVDLTPGDYPVVLRYMLPGTNQVTSTVNLSIKF